MKKFLILFSFLKWVLKLIALQVMALALFAAAAAVVFGVAVLIGEFMHSSGLVPAAIIVGLFVGYFVLQGWFESRA